MECRGERLKRDGMREGRLLEGERKRQTKRGRKVKGGNADGGNNFSFFL